MINSMKKLILLALVATALFVSSCSKEDGGGGSGSGLPGTLYVDFATDGNQSYNFSNGKLSKVTKTMNGPGITGCDITYGSKEIALAISTDRSFGIQDTKLSCCDLWMVTMYGLPMINCQKQAIPSHLALPMSLKNSTRDVSFASHPTKNSLRLIPMIGTSEGCSYSILRQVSSLLISLGNLPAMNLGHKVLPYGH